MGKESVETKAPAKQVRVGAVVALSMKGHQNLSRTLGIVTAINSKMDLETPDGLVTEEVTVLFIAYQTKDRDFWRPWSKEFTTSHKTVEMSEVIVL